MRGGDPVCTLLGESVCLLLKVRLGRTLDSTEVVAPLWNMGESIGPVGVEIREMSLRLHCCMCNAAERGLQPESSLLTLRRGGLHEGHAAERGLRSRASVHPEVTWLPLPEVVGPLPEPHGKCSCSFIQIVPHTSGVLTPAAGVSTEG